MREFVSGPIKCITNVDHGSIDKSDFRTESMIQAHREKPLLQQEAGLSWSNVFSGEDDMATSMYHQSCAPVVSIRVKSQGNQVNTYRLAVFCVL